jgi:hypothetical protein
MRWSVDGFGDLSLDDWREIRVGDYWTRRDALKNSAREYFIRSRIELWKRNKLKR